VVDDVQALLKIARPSIELIAYTESIHKEAEMIENQTLVEQAPAASASNNKWIWWLVGGGCVLLLCIAIVVVAVVLYFVPVNVS
jgi:hypothetical protein